MLRITVTPEIMLHIHNGDSAAGLAMQSSIPGEHFAWREALICGPTPEGLTVEQWRQVRAQHLAEAYGRNFGDCEKQLVAQDQALAKFSDHDEVVLWFEHDLFCQLHLIYLLNWFRPRYPAQTRLSLICINKFAGIDDFRGLGQLNSEQMASLFPLRHQVTMAETELAARAWAAFAAPDPAELATLLTDDISALPFLRAALRKHLARFPSVRNGLGGIENTALELIANGATQFGPLFEKFGAAETIYGFGDAQLLLLLHQLAAAPQPVLTISNGNGTKTTSGSDPRQTSFALTATGESVLLGDDDFIALNGIDTWLGGVHLQGQETSWRWDEQQTRLVKKD